MQDHDFGRGNTGTTKKAAMRRNGRIGHAGCLLQLLVLRFIDQDEDSCTGESIHTFPSSREGGKWQIDGCGVVIQDAYPILSCFVCALRERTVRKKFGFFPKDPRCWKSGGIGRMADRGVIQFQHGRRLHVTSQGLNSKTKEDMNFKDHTHKSERMEREKRKGRPKNMEFFGDWELQGKKK